MKYPATHLLMACLCVAVAPFVTIARADTAPAVAPARVEVVFPNLFFANPLYITHPRDGTDRLFVVEQGGRIKCFDNRNDIAPAEVITAIDISRRVKSGGEEGLLGFAFHPDVKTNHQVFLHYTQRPGKHTIISRFRIDDTIQRIDPASEEVLISHPQPWSNHNGGMIEFGPDGMFYIALGDGGAAGDPQNNSQRKGTLLGKILRIDVNQKSDGLPYSIPPDNPFVNEPKARGEIWAWGLRNAWRFSFDRATGDLWAGDVGQNQWEEIDLIEKGKNYGWNIYEGTHDFRKPGPNDKGPFIKPLAEHPHGQSNSITGGYVYRGKKIPALQGAYVYGDFATGLIWCIRYNADTRAATAPQYFAKVPGIASFGEDRDGELYITSFDGHIYQFKPIP